MIPLEDIVRALHRSENAWDKVFKEGGSCGRRFDRYRITPTAEAISALAIAILTGGDKR